MSYTPSNIPDVMLYPVADALGVELHEMPDGRVRGCDLRKVLAGPWRIDAEVVVVSDVLTPTQCGFFVKVMGNLWLYAISSSCQPLMVCVVDGSIVKLHVKDCTGFGGKSIANTLTKLKPGLITAYSYNPNGTWYEDSVRLVQLSAKQGSVLALLSPPAAA
jgi:hypothetical protein